MFESGSKNGWTRVAFGDVVRLSRERSSDPEGDGFQRYVGLDHMEPGEFRLRRWGDLSAGTTFTNVFRSGQVLFGKRRAYQRKVAVADFEGVCSGDIYVLEAKQERLLPQLLPFICQTDGFFEHAVGTSAGSLSPRTNWESLASYEFGLPPPEEQRRIADLLAAISGAEGSYDSAYSSAAVTTDALISGALLRLQGSTALSQLQERAEVKYGLTVDPSRRMAPTQIPYLRVANVLRAALDLTEIKTVGASRDEAYRLSAGDVLVVEGHANVTEIGRAAVWRNETPEMFHQNHLIRVRCGGSLDPEYLCLILNSLHGRSYFRSHAKSTSGLSTINSTVVKQYAIPVPPRDSQANVVQQSATGARSMNEISTRRQGLARIRRTVLSHLDEACL